VRENVAKEMVDEVESAKYWGEGWGDPLVIGELFITAEIIRGKV
jgi:hypothetical protein